MQQATNDFRRYCKMAKDKSSPVKELCCLSSYTDHKFEALGSNDKLHQQGTRGLIESPFSSSKRVGFGRNLVSFFALTRGGQNYHGYRLPHLVTNSRQELEPDPVRQFCLPCATSNSAEMRGIPVH